MEVVVQLCKNCDELPEIAIACTQCNPSLVSSLPEMESRTAKIVAGLTITSAAVIHYDISKNWYYLVVSQNVLRSHNSSISKEYRSLGYDTRERASFEAALFRIAVAFDGACRWDSYLNRKIAHEQLNRNRMYSL